MRRRGLVGLMGVLALVPLAARAEETWRLGDLVIEHAWARPTPGRAQTGAAYLVIANHGAEPDRLVAAEGPVAGHVELHEHQIDSEGIARMRRVEAVEVPAGGAVALAPGGLHLMLMGLAAPLREGMSFPLRLRFERAGEIEVEVLVGKARGGASGG